MNHTEIYTIWLLSTDLADQKHYIVQKKRSFVCLFIAAKYRKYKNKIVFSPKFKGKNLSIKFKKWPSLTSAFF